MPAGPRKASLRPLENGPGYLLSFRNGRASFKSPCPRCAINFKTTSFRSNSRKAKTHTQTGALSESHRVFVAQLRVKKDFGFSVLHCFPRKRARGVPNSVEPPSHHPAQRCRVLVVANAFSLATRIKPREASSAASFALQQEWRVGVAGQPQQWLHGARFKCP